jgi:glycine/D-amino acid oxidase-like deaminating enzyme
MSMEITISGSGAIGGTLGARLIRAGHDVTLCDADEAHIAAIREHGLIIAEHREDPRYRPVMIAIAREVLAQAPVKVESFDGFGPDDLEGSLHRRGQAEVHGVSVVRATETPYTYSILVLIQRNVGRGTGPALDELGVRGTR